MRYTRLLLALAAAPMILIACEDDSAVGADNEVDIQVSSAGFSPAALTIAPADSTTSGEDGTVITVRWELTDGPHNITFEAGASSPTLGAGQSFERDFTDAAPGVYRYRCTIHSTDFTTGQVGQIVVVN